jgi:uncharacterized protein (TIGR02246 family)
MKTVVCSLLLVTLVAVTGCSATNPQALEDEQIAVEKVHDKEVEAMNAGDVEGVLAVCTDDVVFMPTDQPPVKGREAVHDWLAGFFDQSSVSISNTPEDITVAGDVAIEPWNALVTVTPKDGEAMSNRLKGIYVYHRAEDGSWKIARGIWNLNQPEPRM